MKVRTAVCAFVACTLSVSSAFAQRSPDIVSVSASLTTNRLTIAGDDLDRRGTPVVTLGAAPLVVLSASETQIIAVLPANTPPGTYPLTVTTGFNRSTTIAVTLGVT